MDTFAKLTGLDVILTDQLPVDPSPGEVGRRIVRHGMADVLAWLGEEVGPKPEDQVHMIVMDRRLLTSAEGLATLRGSVT